MQIPEPYFTRAFKPALFILLLLPALYYHRHGGSHTANTFSRHIHKRHDSTFRQELEALHSLVYPISILAIIHFWMMVKLDIREPVIYSILLAILLGERLYRKFKK